MTNKITAMSVFNASMPEQSNPILDVQNLTWDHVAYRGDVERAAGRVTGSLDKATKEITKAVVDVGRDSKRIVDAVKTGTEKVVDAMKRTATTNASGSNPNVPLAVRAIHRGLLDISESADCIAQYLAINPAEMGAATEAAEAVGKRFSELVEATSQCNEGSERLRMQVEEMEKTMDWVDYKFSHAGDNQTVTPSATLPVNNAFFGRIFNAGGTAAPIVGCFNELLGQ